MSGSKTEDRAPATAGEGSDRPLTGASATVAAKSGALRGASSAKDRVSQDLTFVVCLTLRDADALLSSLIVLTVRVLMVCLVLCCNWIFLSLR